jgi:anti-anti-sigma factor
MALEVKVRQKNDTPIIVLIGRVIGVDVEKFTKKLESFYKKKSSRIVIDISKAGFLDSHALGKIVYYFHIMEKENRELVLLNVNSDSNMYVSRLFSLTNLDRVIRIAKTEEELWGRMAGADNVR